MGAYKLSRLINVARLNQPSDDADEWCVTSAAELATGVPCAAPPTAPHPIPPFVGRWTESDGGEGGGQSVEEEGAVEAGASRSPTHTAYPPPQHKVHAQVLGE